MKRAVAILALTAGLAAAAVAAGAPVGFRTVERDEGASSAITDRVTIVVRTARRWRSVWARLHEGMSPPPRRPRVDFSRRMLILVTQGQKPSGGYSVRVRSVESRRTTWLVRADERVPGPSCTTTAVITAPYHVIKVRRTPKRIVTRRSVSEYDCALYQP